MTSSLDTTLLNQRENLTMQTTAGHEVESFDHLSVPKILLHGETPEERKNDLLFSAVIRAYMCHEISMMKAGEFLGCKDYNSVSRLFKAHNIPTIKQAPADVEEESERNRLKLEQQLGL